MSVTISPLDLMLDTENPRFVILSTRKQEDIRKYLVTYEDVCQLATAINEYGSLLPGERIVVLQEGDHYTVVEGNRRTCSLQLLLSRDLIPDGFAHRIPHTSDKILENCSNIEVDVLPDRNAALELMSKRHIEGVKQWKPLAKKQFFAANYKDGQGQSVYDLSRITGIKESEIKEDIRDYKFFFYVYEKYDKKHSDFDKEIIVLKTDPFWRIFKAKFEYPKGKKVSPKDFFDITYDGTLNTICGVDKDLFEQVALLVFEKAIVQEAITTRNVLTDVEGIYPLLQAIIEKKAKTTPESEGNENTDGSGTKTPPVDNSGEQPPQNGNSGATPPQDDTSGSGTSESNTGDNRGPSGGPKPGGPPPRTFFETLSWRGKLDPTNRDHQGLLCAVNELYGLSKVVSPICLYQPARSHFSTKSGQGCPSTSP